MNKRQTKIYELLAREGEITVRRLAELCRVSEMTIYRDAAELEAIGVLFRKRGALVYNEKAERVTAYLPEKTAIARLAAERIAEGDSVLFDNSTTALEVAKLLAARKHITVYATSLDVANAVCANPDITLYVGGGYYAPDSTGLVGGLTEYFVEQLHPDKCVLGTSGIHPEFGFTCPYPAHVSLEQKIIKSAEEVIVVADHTKFGKRAMNRIAPIEAATCIITDDAVDPTLLSTLREQTEILIATVSDKRKERASHA